MVRLGFTVTTTLGRVTTSLTTAFVSSSESFPMHATDVKPPSMDTGYVAKLMRSHGFSCTVVDAQVVVDDPVHTLQGGTAIATGTIPVIVRSLSQAWRFLDQRT